MILGFTSIGLTIAVIIGLWRTNRAWPYYASIYVVGSCLLLSTTLASSQLIGSDIHLEYYYAKQALLNGWDVSLPCTINSCLPIVLMAPALTGVGGEHNLGNLIWVFKVIYPLLYALVPVLLLYIYSRFMPLKWAFLSAMVFIIVPTFFLEMPAISRQMIAELIVVSMAALLVSKQKHEHKMLGLCLGSLAVVVSHYSTATFWFVFLTATVGGYYISGQKWRTLDIVVILGISVGFFFWYSHWAANGWQVVDYGNTVSGIIESMKPVAPATPGSTGLTIGTPSSTNVNWLPIALTVILLFGIYRLLRSNIPKLYKAWIATATALLIFAIIYPAIANTINYTRYYHMMLIFLAPAAVFTFYKLTVPLTATALVLIFFVSSGLLFNILKIDNIQNPNIPYSIALENERLDAGNYLNDNDANVAEWAFKNSYKKIYGDIGGNLVTQDYFYMFDALPLKEQYQSKDIIIVRTWNTLHGWSKWVGAGLRRTEPMTLPEGRIIYQSGQAYIWEVN